MLVDGQLIEAESGKTFDNVNPATEEVLGAVADASTAEMQRAIDAARRAFDDSNWSTDRAFRKRGFSSTVGYATRRAAGPSTTSTRPPRRCSA